jgi:hypothetical protein
VAELSIRTVLKANTSKETMMEKPKPVDFDAEEANRLLDVIYNTKELPSFQPLNHAAMINLSIMSADVEEQLAKRAEEAKKVAEAESVKAQKARDEEKQKEPAHEKW